MLIRARQRAFTLIELVIFIVIVSVAVAGVTLQFSSNVAQSASPLLRQKAIAIAHTYLDQMQTVKWDETTPDGGGVATSPTGASPYIEGVEICSLEQIDDFDDFGCFQNVVLADNFKIDIDIFFNTPITPSWGTIAKNNYKKAVISVTTPIGEILTIPLYRANY